MAVKLVTSVEYWIGLSTDTKPATPTYVGSEFLELNTGNTFIWNGAAWVPDPTVSNIDYNPGLKDTGDLEGATPAIAVAAEPAPQYNSVQTMAIPTDTRMAIVNIASRLGVTIDSFNAGCAHLYCRVYVDVLDAAHRLFDIDWNAIGAKVSGANLTAGVIFNLLNNGAAHTFFFAFWVDAGNAVISEVRLWEGVGAYGGGETEILTVTHIGDFWCGCVHTGAASGTYYHALARIASALDSHRFAVHTSARMYKNTHFGCSDIAIHYRGWGSVATDIMAISSINFTLRSNRP